MSTRYNECLPNTWDDLIVFQRYHSIHAKGGSLQDLEKVVEERYVRVAHSV